MIDGKRDADDLQKFATATRAPADWLAQLVALGYVVDSVVDSGGGPAMASPVVTVKSDAPAAPATTVPAPTTQVPGSSFDRFREASGMVRELVRESFGMKAFFFTLKVEKCSTPADLRALLPEIETQLVKAKGPLAARALLQSLERLLAD